MKLAGKSGSGGGGDSNGGEAIRGGFDQNTLYTSRKFSNNVSFRIFILILFEQIRHRNHFIIVTIIHLLSQNNQITIF